MKPSSDIYNAWFIPKKRRTIMLENSMKFNPQGLQLFVGNSIMT